MPGKTGSRNAQMVPATPAASKYKNAINSGFEVAFMTYRIRWNAGLCGIISQAAREFELLHGVRMSQEKRLEIDPVSWSQARERIGQLLRELYNQPQEPSPQLAALIAKLAENNSLKD
jgi:hypothetical protein